MASGVDLLQSMPVRMLSLGYPGAGKTGAIAALLNVGFKVRVLAFDKLGNMQPLLKYAKPDCLKNLDIVLLEDKLRSGPKFIEVSGLPTAFVDGLKLMDHWQYTKADGTKVELGSSKDWGSDTIVVLDTLTSQGEAAKRRAMAMLNKTPLSSTQQMWGLAMADQYAFLEKLVSGSNEFHVIANAHLKMVGPKDILPNDDDTTKEIKERLVDLVPTRLYPSALGQQLPPTIAGLFPTVVLFENVYKANHVNKVIRTKPMKEMDLKVAADLPDNLDIASGMLTIFEALAPLAVARVRGSKPKSEATGQQD